MPDFNLRMVWNGKRKWTITADWKTPEHINVKPVYTKEDLEGMAQTDALPGEFPYLRGNKKDNNRWYVRPKHPSNRP